MKRVFPLLAMLVTLSGLHAQPLNPDLQSMIDTEKAFIEMAKTQNRRDAFLYFLSDSAVTQGPQGPVRGKARIQQQLVSDDWLYWEVAYSDIASSGDFGFNTGPWEYRAKKTDEKPVAFGEFNSVWKKQPDGFWRNILDIGISHGAPAGRVEWATTINPLGSSTNQNAPKGKENMVGLLEKDFLESVARDRNAAYRKSISSEVRMMVTGRLPFTGDKKLEEYLNACPVVINTRILGSETARSADMGYVFGTADAVVSSEGKTETKQATFVRIWKKEGAKQWKVVLDVLAY